MGRRRCSDLDRFLAKTREVESGCLEWQSTINRTGYGKFSICNKQVPAHRAAWMLQVGPIPEGKWVLHHCDNRRCVNIRHLYCGTPSDNVRDKIERCPWWGRMTYGLDDRRNVMRLRSQGLSQQAIADLTGIHQTTVSKMLRGKGILQKRL